MTVALTDPDHKERESDGEDDLQRAGGGGRRHGKRRDVRVQDLRPTGGQGEGGCAQW